MSNRYPTTMRPNQLANPQRRSGGSLGVWSLIGSFDPLLVVTTLALALFGVLMVTSATRDSQIANGLEPYHYLQKQGAFVGLGLIAMTIVASVDYRRYLDLSPALYVLSLLSLVVVLFMPAHNGAHGWYQIGEFQLQPAEFAKPVLIVVLAAYGSAQRNQLDGRRLTVAMALAAVPIGLIYLEPDLGGALILTVIVAAMVWVAGADRAHLFGLVVAGLTAAFAAVRFGVLKEYQVNRLTGFLGQSYNVTSSKIAIGSGGITGRGLFAGDQTRYGFVPERHTDFIFSVVGEKLGLLGALVLLAAFAALCWRILRVGVGARDTGGMLICVGVMVMLAFQIFENIGMTMQIMPVTGIPLPFVSYGGSSTIMEFSAIGLVLNVYRHRH